MVDFGGLVCEFHKSLIRNILYMRIQLMLTFSYKFVYRCIANSDEWLADNKDESTENLEALIIGQHFRC